MFKIIVLLKRKPGISMEEFKNYYETHHVKLAQRLAAGTPTRLYFRNYLTPYGNYQKSAQGAQSPEEEAPYDCVTEVFYENEEHFRKYQESVSAHKYELFSKDEENFIDR